MPNILKIKEVNILMELEFKGLTMQVNDRRHTTFIRYIACVAGILEKLFTNHSLIMFPLWNMNEGGFSCKIVIPENLEESNINGDFIFETRVDENYQLLLKLSISPFETCYANTISLESMDDSLEDELIDFTDMLANVLQPIILKPKIKQGLYEPATPNEIVKCIRSIDLVESNQRYSVAFSDNSVISIDVPPNCTLNIKAGGFLHFKDGEQPTFYDKQSLH